MKLTATQQFTDKSGTVRQTGESFDIQNDQEAQDYIRKGQAQEQGKGQQQGQEQTRNK